jgi:hypothetical protein
MHPEDWRNIAIGGWPSLCVPDTEARLKSSPHIARIVVDTVLL